MNKELINKIKKHLNVSKQDLILLAVYKTYGVEFEDVKKACEFVLDKIDNDSLNDYMWRQ